MKNFLNQIEKRKEYHELFNKKMIDFKNKVKEIKNLFEKLKQKELNKENRRILNYNKSIVNPSKKKIQIIIIVTKHVIIIVNAIFLWI